MTSLRPILVAASFCCLAAAARAEPVNNASVIDNADSGTNWPVSGGNFSGSHYSPLQSINDSNVSTLGLAWATHIPMPDGIAGTPIVVDGTIYLSTAYSHVYAVSADTGKILWSHQSGVEAYLANNPRASWIARANRGVAVWDGRVYVATADCRLLALDAATGVEAWSAVTCDVEKGFAISDAPHVGGGKVFIGNAGSESQKQNRGHVSAWDARTGKMLWRFYTVPSADEAENTSPAMKMAAKTWDGDALQKYGGGGSNWNEMTYDPESNLLFFGTAGAVPYLHKDRSPGGLDNLFDSSIIALNADTGEYVWHYQTVPQDSWDYNATMNIITGELNFAGKSRDVAMIAPKNGFFYVFDKLTGELLSADKYAKVNWATHVNLETGRPVLDPEGMYWDMKVGETRAIWPNMWGAHSWQPMARHPKTGLVYIPVSDTPTIVTWQGEGEYSEKMGLITEVDGQAHDPGRLLAWDPVAKTTRWFASRSRPFNGGILATGGNLVFQGTATGSIDAFSADEGDLLWSLNTGSAINSAPVTFLQNGRQMLVVAAGAGGGMQFSYPELHGTKEMSGPTRLLAFTLEAPGVLRVESPVERRVPDLPNDETPAKVVAAGAHLFKDNCGGCHGQDAVARVGGSVPDLRYSTLDVHANWNDIVIEGNRNVRGMPSFDLEPAEADAIRIYVLSLSRQLATH